MISNTNKMREILTFAIPLSANMFIGMFVNFASMYMLAQLGEKALAAGALAATTYMTFSMVSLIFYAIGIMVSHQKGQENAAIHLGEIVKNGLVMAFFLALPMSILLMNADYLLILFRQDPELIHLTRSYFHYSAFFLPPSLISMVILQFFIGLGHPRVSLFISIVTVPITLLLCYGFILGKFGFPQLELGGITASLAITTNAICISLLGVIFFAKRMQKYQIRKHFFQINFILIKKIFLLGFPIGIQFGAELAAISVATYFMGHFGTTPLASAQLVSQYSLLIVTVILGLSQSVTILCSQAYGKNDIPAIKQYVKSAAVVLSVFFSIISIFWIFYAKQLTVFFIGQTIAQNSIFMNLTHYFFIISIFVFYADGIRNILSAGLRGLHDSSTPMTIGVLCLWFISLPACYVIGYTFHGGPIGLRLGFSSGFIVAVMILIRRLDRLVRKKITA